MTEQKMKPRHLRSIADIGGREGAEKLFKLADAIKAEPKKFRKALDDKIIASLFCESSTGTRVTFDAAALSMGAQVIPVSGTEATSLAKGESIEDTVRRIQGAVDAIVLRHVGDDSAERAASVAKIPIFCGGAGKAHHPTQSLLDVFTLREYKRRIDELALGILGDGLNGRTIHSLLEFLSMYEKIKIYECTLEGFGLEQKYIDIIRGAGGEYIKVGNIEDIPRDVDGLYYTRLQAERDERMKDPDFVAEVEKSKKAQQLTLKRLSRFSKDTLVMHPLPRNSTNGDAEITDEVVGTKDAPGDTRCIIFEQAENGLHTRKAILMDRLY